MKKISLNELNEILMNADRVTPVDLSNISFEGMCLQGIDFRHVNLSGSSFKNADISGANFEFSNLTGVNIEGANLFCADLENALLENIVYDENTQFYRMRCPEKGAFIAWKKSFNNRLIQLLIPADAKRSSATGTTCRADKAKVLSIKSFDSKIVYKEAYSYADEHFVYRVGEMAFASAFSDDRWKDSTAGIHFFMSREEAIGYL